MSFLVGLRPDELQDCVNIASNDDSAPNINKQRVGRARRGDCGSDVCSPPFECVYFKQFLTRAYAGTGRFKEADSLSLELYASADLKLKPRVTGELVDLYAASESVGEKNPTQSYSRQPIQAVRDCGPHG